MAMPIYPVLSMKPSVKKFGHSLVFDPVHRTRFGSGAILSRPLFSDTPDGYDISYSLLPDADKLILEAWVKDDIAQGGLRFEFTLPTTDVDWVTLLMGPVIYKINPKSKGDIWIVNFKIAIFYEVV